MNKIVLTGDKFMTEMHLRGDKFMPEMHLDSLHLHIVLLDHL